MGLFVTLTNEAGENLGSVADDRNFLHQLLPSNENATNPMLASIDRYGDTVFNSVQMRRFLSEWNLLQGRALGIEERQLADAVKKLAQRCRDEIHLYLKFIGD